MTVCVDTNTLIQLADCAIAANADFIITEDQHFAALINAGYRPQPISPQDFITRFLTPPAS